MVINLNRDFYEGYHWNMNSFGKGYFSPSKYFCRLIYISATDCTNEQSLNMQARESTK